MYIIYLKFEFDILTEHCSAFIPRTFPDNNNTNTLPYSMKLIKRSHY